MIINGTSSYMYMYNKGHLSQRLPEPDGMTQLPLKHALKLTNILGITGKIVPNRGDATYRLSTT